MPDPARAWGEPRPNGKATLASLGVDPARAPTLVLAGDIHHYERSREGRASTSSRAAGARSCTAFASRRTAPTTSACRVSRAARVVEALASGCRLFAALGRAGWLLAGRLRHRSTPLALVEHFRGGVRGISACRRARNQPHRRIRHRAARRMAPPPAAPCGARSLRRLGLVVGAIPVAIGIGN